MPDFNQYEKVYGDPLGFIREVAVASSEFQSANELGPVALQAVLASQLDSKNDPEELQDE